MPDGTCSKCKRDQAHRDGEICRHCESARGYSGLSGIDWLIRSAKRRDDGDFENLLWIREEFIRLKKKAGE